MVQLEQAGFRFFNRFDFQRAFVRGRILNVGVYDDPARLWRDFGAVNLDINDLRHWYPERFVCGRAEEIDKIFRAKTFDTVVLGDILEHVKNPAAVLKNALFVGHRVIITVPSAEHDKRYAHLATPREGNLKQFEHIQQFEQADIETMVSESGAFVRCFACVDIPHWCGWFIVLESWESLQI